MQSAIQKVLKLHYKSDQSPLNTLGNTTQSKRIDTSQASKSNTDIRNTVWKPGHYLTQCVNNSTLLSFGLIAEYEKYPRLTKSSVSKYFDKLIKASYAFNAGKSSSNLAMQIFKKYRLQHLIIIHFRVSILWYSSLSSNFFSVLVLFELVIYH